MYPFFEHTPLTTVRKGNILFFSMCDASMNRERHHIPARFAKGNLVEQTEIVYKKLGMALEANGASFKDLVRTHQFIMVEAAADLDAAMEVRKRFLGGSQVADVSVFVTRNLHKGALIMVDAIATVGGKKETIKISDKWTGPDAIKVGDWVFTAGIGPFDPQTGELIGKDDILAQTKQIFANLEATINKAGGTYADAIRTVDWIDKRGLGRQYAQTGPVRKAFHRDAPTCSTGIIINRHANTDVLMLVDITCVITGERKSLTFKHPRYDNLIYREGLQKGNVITLSGNCSIDYTSRDILYVGDLQMQTRQTLYSQQAGLRVAGSDYNDVVKMCEYITPEVWDQHDKSSVEFQNYCQGSPVAWTTVCCDQLLMGGLLTEIDVFAIQGPKKEIVVVNSDMIE